MNFGLHLDNFSIDDACRHFIFIRVDELVDFGFFFSLLRELVSLDLRENKNLLLSQLLRAHVLAHRFKR